MASSQTTFSALFQSLERLEETLQSLEQRFEMGPAIHIAQGSCSPERQLMTFEESLYHLESSLNNQELLPWSPPCSGQDIADEKEAVV